MQLVSTVRPKQCPKCHKNIDVGNRYGNAVRQVAADVTDVDNLVTQHSSVPPEAQREKLKSNFVCEEHTFYAKRDPVYGLRYSNSFSALEKS
jgi:hypothetical protein